MRATIGVFSSHRLAAGAVLCLLALLVPHRAQADAKSKPKPYALIYGTVWDPDGHPLYAVKVKIRRAGEKRARWELYSNHTGEFAQRVPVGPGDYVVWADVKGYKLPDGRRLHPGPEVKVHIDGDERTDIGLHLTW
jgi:hypothetical protein